MVEHLIDRALHALQVHRAETEDHEPEMADARVRDQLLHVWLHHRHQRAVDDADDGEEGDDRRHRERCLRKERKREAQQAIRAHLEQHAGKDHRPGGRCLDVGVRQPGMEREERHLDGKGDGKGQEEPALHAFAQAQAVEIEQVEAGRSVRSRMSPGQADDGDEHQHAAGHRIEDELDGGINPPLVSPDPDEEVHRDEHRIPEDVEEEQIDRDEHAEHGGLEREHEEREQLDVLVHRLPRAEERQRRQETGQHDQKQADAVDADQVLNPEHRHPGVGLDKLVVGAGRIEPPPEHERHSKGQERRRQRDVAHQRLALGPIAAPAGQERQDRAHERKKDD